MQEQLSRRGRPIDTVQGVRHSRLPAPPPLCSSLSLHDGPRRQHRPASTRRDYALARQQQNACIRHPAAGSCTTLSSVVYRLVAPTMPDVLHGYCRPFSEEPEMDIRLYVISTTVLHLDIFCTMHSALPACPWPRATGQESSTCSQV